MVNQGLSPRVRGNPSRWTAFASSRMLVTKGLSPRVRGNPDLVDEYSTIWVYPRAYGGTALSQVDSGDAIT